MTDQTQEQEVQTEQQQDDPLNLLGKELPTYENLPDNIKRELGLIQNAEDTEGQVVVKQYVPPTWYLATDIGDGVGIWSGDTAVQDAEPPLGSKWAPDPAMVAAGPVYLYKGVWYAGIARTDTEKLLATIKRLAEQRFNVQVEALGAGYPVNERASWDRQEIDAEAYKATGKASKFLTALQIARGITMDDLVDTILERADTYNTAYATLLGQYQKTIRDSAIDLAKASPLYLIGRDPNLIV